MISVDIPLHAQTSAFGALLPILTKHYYKYHEDAEDSSKPNVIREKLAPAFFDLCSTWRSHAWLFGSGEVAADLMSSSGLQSTWAAASSSVLPFAISSRRLLRPLRIQACLVHGSATTGRLSLPWSPCLPSVSYPVQPHAAT